MWTEPCVPARDDADAGALSLRSPSVKLARCAQWMCWPAAAERAPPCAESTLRADLRPSNVRPACCRPGNEPASCMGGGMHGWVGVGAEQRWMRVPVAAGATCVHVDCMQCSDLPKRTQKHKLLLLLLLVRLFVCIILQPYHVCRYQININVYMQPMTL